MKKTKEKRRKKLNDDEINDGLKQSKIPFERITESEEEFIEIDEKSESNSNKKHPILHGKDLKNGSKKGSKKKKDTKRTKTQKSKSVDNKTTSRSKSSSKSRTKSKTKKVKIKKGVEYMKGKYNTRVELIEEDKNLEDEDNKVNNTCCVVCSNRNCIRAAKTKNYKLMKNCIKDREHISSLINPYSISIGSAIEIAIENKDKKIIEMIFNSWNDDNDPKKELKPRCYIEKQNKIS